MQTPFADMQDRLDRLQNDIEAFEREEERRAAVHRRQQVAVSVQQPVAPAAPEVIVEPAVPEFPIEKLNPNMTPEEWRQAAKAIGAGIIARTKEIRG